MDNYIAHNAMLTEMMAADHDLIMALKKEIQTLKGRQMIKQTEALKMAIEAFDKIDMSNQSNEECARGWFIEGYVQALKEKNSCS